MDTVPLLNDAARLRVLVVPVAGLATAKFMHYLGLLQRAASEIAMVDLTAMLSEQQASSFFHRQTLKPGALRLAYVSESWATSTEWDRLNMYRRVVAAIGLVDCSQPDVDLADAARQFGELCDRYDDLWERRCFGVEQTAELRSTATDGRGAFLVGVSAIQLNEEGRAVVLIPNQEEDKVAFYLATMMADVASGILLTLSKQVALMEDTSVDVDHRTLLDAPQRLKRKAPPRTHKYAADACLLGGSISEALALYNSAIELSKQGTNIDWLCLGGSLEGLVCASMMLEKSTTAISSTDVVDKYRDAITAYENAGAGELAAEACLKMAAFAMDSQRPLLTNEFLTRANEYKPTLSIRYQMFVLTTCIKLYGNMGFGRKAAFHMREASRVLATVNVPSALKILHNLLKSYDIVVDTEEARSHVLVEWPRIQTFVLQELIRLSEQIDDIPQCVYYTGFLLRNYTNFLTPTEQQSLLTRLVQFSNQLKGAALIRGSLDDLPVVTSMEFCSPPAALKPIPHTSAVAASDPTDPFIYNPFQRSSSGVAVISDQPSTEILLVQNEHFHVKLTLQNILAVDILVKNLQLFGTGVAIESPGVTINVPAKSFGVNVIVSGTALEPGIFTIKGVQMTVFQMQRERFAVVKISSKPRQQKHRKTDSTSKREPKRDRTVIDPDTLPYLKLSVINELPRVQVLDSDLLSQPISLWEGELINLELTLENIGTQHVSFLEIDVEEKHARPPSAEDDLVHNKFPLVRVQQEALKARLPLRSRSVMAVSFSVFGRVGCTGAILRVDYGQLSANGDRPGFTRQLSVPLAVQCVPKLKIASVSLEPLSTTDKEAILSLEIVNMSDESAAMFIYDPTTAPLLLPPGGSASRADIKIARATEDAIDLEAELPMLGDRQYVVSGLAPEQERLRRQLYWMRHALADQLNMSWTIPTSGRRGLYPAELLPLTARHVDSFKMPALVARLEIIGNKETLRRQETVDLLMTITNSHKTKTFLATFELRVVLYGETHPVSECTHILLFEGPNLSSLSLRIGPEERRELSLPVVFVSTGQLVLDLVCSGRSIEPPSTKHAPNLPVCVQHTVALPVSIDDDD